MKHIGKIKDRLLERKRELENEFIDLNTEKFSDDQVQDPGDQALESTMESLRKSFADTKHDEYKSVLLSLQQIEDGTYGACIECEKPIAPKRLELFPYASRCLSCQETFEEG